MGIQAIVLSGVGSSGGSGGAAPGAVVTAIAGAEIGPVFQDENQGLHTIISGTPTVSALPTPVTFWVDQQLGLGWQNQGPFNITTAGESITFGNPQATTAIALGGGGIWVPTDPANGTWKIAAFAGIITDANPPVGFVQSTFTVNAAQPCLATDCTGIQFIPNTAGGLINYVLEGVGSYVWLWNELDWVQPTAIFDVYYDNSIVTVQKGYASTGTATISSGTALQDTGAAFVSTQQGFVIHVAGVWNTIAAVVDATHLTLTTAATNGTGVAYEIWNRALLVAGTTEVDHEGINEDADLLYYGREFGSSSSSNGAPEVLGSTVALVGDLTDAWTYPLVTNPDGSTNLYRTFRFENYAISRLGQNPNGGPASGTYTRQTGWPGGADHFDLTPAAQPSALDLTQSNSNTLGRGVTKHSVTNVLETALGNGLGFDLSGNNTTKLAGGLAFDGSGNNIANLGYTMQVNGSGQIVIANLPAVFGLPSLPSAVYPAGAVILNTADNKVYRNPTGSAWLVSAAPGDLVTGAISTGVTLAAAQVTAGTFISGVAYIGAIACSQLQAGTIAAAISMTSPSLTVTGGAFVVNLNSSTGLTVTGGSTTTTIANLSGASIIGLRVADGSGRSQVAADFVDVEDSSGNVLAQLVQAVSGATRGLVSVSNPSTSHTATLDPDSGFTQIGATSGYTGTLAGAVGKSFIGGILVN